MTYEELQAQLAAQCDTFRRTGAFVDGTKIVTQFLTNLAAVERTEADAVLTLKQAAVRSGYSVDHLARLIRQGHIPNAGRPHAPRIRVSDLPHRQFAKTRPGSYSVDADARTLKAGRQ